MKKRREEFDQNTFLEMIVIKSIATLKFAAGVVLLHM